MAAGDFGGLVTLVTQLMPAIAVYARVFAKPDELVSLRGDAIATLAWLYQGGKEPAEPGPRTCGTDTTPSPKIRP